MILVDSSVVIPPRPRPHSPAVPVPPPLPSNPPSSCHSVTTTFPSFPAIEVAVPDPSPRSRTPRRDTDPLFSELIPVRHTPWVQQAGVTPVGAQGTTPLCPPAPGTAIDPATDPFLSMDIRDFNPPNLDIAKGKGKGKGKPLDKGRGKGKKGQGKGRGKPKGKEERAHPSTCRFCPTSQRERQEITSPHTLPSPIARSMARLVIVAGPALLASPHFFLYSTPPFSTSPHPWPGLPLWQVPPSNLILIPIHPSSPSLRPGLTDLRGDDGGTAPVCP